LFRRRVQRVEDAFTCIDGHRSGTLEVGQPHERHARRRDSWSVPRQYAFTQVCARRLVEPAIGELPGVRVVLLEHPRTTERLTKLFDPESGMCMLCAAGRRP